MLSSSRNRAPSIALFEPKWWKVACALFLALLAQTTLFPQLGMRGTPSLTLLLITWYAMKAGIARGTYFGLIVGACEDALAVTGAAWTFADASVGAFAAAIARVLPYDSPFLAAPITVPLTIARYIMFLFVLHVEHQTFHPAGAHWNTVLWQSLLNVGTALLVAALAVRFDFSDVER